MQISKTLNSINWFLPVALTVFLNIGLSTNSVLADSQIMKVEDIEIIGKNFMFNSLDWDKGRMDIKVSYEGQQIRIPKGNVKFDCKLPGRKNRIGRVHFLCLIKIEGKIKKRLHLYADVKVTYDIYRPIQSLKMGHVIKPGDVELSQIKSDQTLRNLVSDENEILGHRLIKNLDQGETILAHMIQRVPLVKNGDRILIIAQKGSLRVTAPGVVRQNGFKDDTVRVENIHSNKIILGTVQDSRTVLINF